jgi:hypothetical protein
MIMRRTYEVAFELALSDDEMAAIKLSGMPEQLMDMLTHNARSGLVNTIVETDVDDYVKGWKVTVTDVTIT